MTDRIGPSHQLVADDIRARITSGEYEVGAPIPSTKKLVAQYEMSPTVVRHAVERLRADGVLIGHPGKAVYVRAKPGDAAVAGRDLKALTETVAELKRRTEGYTELEQAVSRLESNLMDLYARFGFEYSQSRQAGRKQQDEAMSHG